MALLASLLLAALLPFGQSADTTAAAPSVRALAVDAGALRVDGRLDEAAWAAADVASGFVQLRPNAGQAAGEATEARVLLGDDALYVGIRLRDREPGRIDARLVRRDADANTDWTYVIVDSYGEGRTGFGFAVSAGGVQRDMLFYDDSNEDDSWDAVWDAATTRDDGGWTAEFRIPLSQLRFATGRADASWGIQFGRDVMRTGETSLWAPVDPSSGTFVSRFGRLTGLGRLRAPRRLEVTPYVATSVTRAPGEAANPYYAATDAAPRVGADLKLGLTGDLTLTAAVNPDFGQVEADPAQVNLGAFELFLEERRPFFVEGADIFSFDRTRAFFRMNRPSLLYTRRIGRAPQRTGFVPSAVRADARVAGGTVYTDVPAQTPILGAAKVSGRVGRVSVGALGAVTGRQWGRYQAFDGTGAPLADGREVVEPPTAYGVVRARTTLGRTIVGTAGTLVARSAGDAVLADLLPREALVGSVDVEHPLAAHWMVTGLVAGSHVGGTPAAITLLQNAFPRLYGRPDAAHLSLDPAATTLRGLTGELAVVRNSGQWMGQVGGSFTSPGFDANGLGYQGRADDISVGGLVIRQQNTPQGAFRRWSSNVAAGVSWNFGGDRRGTFLSANANGQLRSFWSVNGNLSLNARAVDDRLTRGGPLAGSPAYFYVNGNVSSDGRKRVHVYAWSGAGAGEIGGWDYDAEAGVTVRPSPAVSVQVGPALSLGHAARQFVRSLDAPEAAATFGRRYVFGALDQATASLSFRTDWTFTPRLTLQLFARPFLSSGRYVRFSQMTAPGQTRFPAFGNGAGTAETLPDGSVRLTPADGGAAFTVSPDYSVRALQGNAVLRWEWRPGSALFVVWQHGRDGSAGDGRFRPGAALADLWDDAPTNVFLVKWSYWLGG